MCVRGDGRTGEAGRKAGKKEEGEEEQEGNEKNAGSARAGEGENGSQKARLLFGALCHAAPSVALPAAVFYCVKI